jgi:alpha-tubulin suppressor-like RCC1 family protein
MVMFILFGLLLPFTFGCDDNVQKMGQETDYTIMSNSAANFQVDHATIDQIVAAGFLHSMYLQSNGTVWSWGNNFHGQLGDGTLTEQYEPMQVKDLSDVVMVVVGARYSLAMKSDGTLWGWGNNYHGQLGDGTKECTLEPVQVQFSKE